MEIDTTVGIGEPETMIIALHLDTAGRDRKKFLHDWADGILALSHTNGVDLRAPNFLFLALSLKSCSGSVTYRTVDDVPLADVACPCGDPLHWLIKWSEVD